MRIAAHRVSWAVLPVLLAASLGAVPATASAATGTTGTVTGVATDAGTGTPLAGVCVTIVDASTNTTVGTSKPSGASGVWKVPGLSTSTTLTAIGRDCKGRDYQPIWYQDTEFQANATDFTVTAGMTTTGIDLPLSLGGAVSGKVTDAATKAPVAGILVVAFFTTQFATAAATCTSSKGTYLMKGLPTDGVKIEYVSGACGSTSYPTAWYKGATGYDTATVVPVTAGVTTKGIKQALSAG